MTGRTRAGRRPILCPSAPAEAEDARAFGVVTRDAGRGRRVRWLEKPVPVTPELLSKTGDVAPTRVMRFAGSCQEKSCAHFNGSDCELASRLVHMLDPVTDTLPPCTIRRDCRWFKQEGAAACQRCPQVATESNDTDTTMREAARPSEASPA